MTRRRSSKKYGPYPRGKCARKKVHEVMKEYKEGKLKSGHGAEVKKREQAIAIALSEARRACPMSGGARILKGLKKYYT